MTQKLHIIVLLAFLTGIIAPACGFMWGGNYSVIEICTSNGIENRVIANDDQPSTPQTQDQCEFCFTSANLTAFLMPEGRHTKIAYAAEKIRFEQYEDIVLTRFQTNISSRGPPSFI